MPPNSPSRHQTRILPALRQIQNQFGYLEREELKRFSNESGVHLYQIQAVASFFPHFRPAPPPKVAVRVCRDMACQLAGSATLVKELSALKSEDIAIETVSCLGRCDRSPAVSVAVHQTADGHSARGRAHHQEFFCLGRDAAALKQMIANALEGKNTPADADLDSGRSYPAADWEIDVYKDRTRDYGALKQVLARSGGAEWVLAELEAAHLRGMGGAGIAASQKWSDVRNAVISARRRGTDSRAYVVVNGDESEPATFKDRELLLHFPHLVLEGLIIAGLVTGATEGFIYIRHEFPEQIEACRAEIERAEKQGICGVGETVLGRPFPVSVFVSPGGYICGEQSALIEAMSDRRGEPRNMPPGLETNGLDDRPTLISNVETFAWVPYIVQRSGRNYAEAGTSGHQGRRFFSICGDVNRPGVYEVPIGIPLRELLCDQRYCQGVVGGVDKLKAIAPSGPSGGFLPRKLTAAAGLPHDYHTLPEWQELASRRRFDPNSRELDILDLELDLDLFRALSPTHSLGAGIVVYAEGRDMAQQAVNALEFFRNESCGKCVPCRSGAQKLANLGTNLLAGRVRRDSWHDELRPLVDELSEAMVLSSICGLGRSVPMPLETLIDYFGQDLEQHLI